MAQSGYTPIQLYFSTTAAAVPVNTNLANGELAINITDGKLYYKNNGGTVTLLASSAGSLGDVVGPASATDKAIATFDGTTGKLIQNNSGVTITSGILTATGFAGPLNGTVGATTANTGAFTTLSATGVATFSAGTVSLPAITTSGDTNTSIFFPAADTIAFTEGGVESMRIDASGNLGLGVTPSAWGGGFKAFETTGTSLGSNAAGSSYYLQNSYYNGTNFIYTTTLAASYYAQISGAHRWYNAPSGTAGTTATFTLAMTLDASSNLGLGVTLSAWSGYSALQTSGGSMWGSSNLGILSTNTYFNSGYKYATTNFAEMYQQSSGAHTWHTAASGTAGNAITFTQAMTLDASGNLGLGTSSPISASGYIQQTINGTSGSYLNLRTNGTTVLSVGSDGGNAYINGPASAGSVIFQNAGSERLRIASTGAFGLSGANYGTSGQVLTSGGSGAAPTWTTVSGGGGSPATPTVAGLVLGSTGTGTTAFGGYNAGVANTSGTQNTAFGSGAFSTNSTGSANAAFGSDALRVSTGDDNTAVGARALYTNSTGSQQTAVGRLALYLNTTGTSNTAVGQSSLQANINGSFNTAVGVAALTTNSSASNNTAVGHQALSLTNTGAGNTAVGQNAAYANTTGANNVALGFSALDVNTTSSNNVAIGADALGQASVAISGFGGETVAIGYRAFYSLGTVASNGSGGCTAIGHAAGYSTSSAGNGAYDTFIGYLAGYYNVSGYGCTFVGSQAGFGQTSGNSNTIVGQNAGRQTSGAGGGNNTFVGTGSGSGNSGNDNTFVGAAAGASNAGASENTYFGTYAGQACTGGQNVAVGKGAMYSSVAANYNTAIGRESLYSNVSGSYHTAVGWLALNSATDNSNVAVGYQAGRGVTSGHSNVLLGTNAAYATVITTGGALNVVIGSNAYTNTAGAYQEIVIGAGCNGLGNDRVAIGKLNSRIWAQYDSSATWTYASDVRLKKDIENDSLGLAFINKLRPVKYRWKATNELERDNPQYNEVNNKNLTAVMHGLIAQEVKAALDAEGVSTFEGWNIEPNGIQCVSREMFITPLINAVQELTAQIETLKAEVAALKGA